MMWKLLQLIPEVLSQMRHLSALVEAYAARRAANPEREAAMQEFQQAVAEALRESRQDSMELRSAIEAVQQRLKVIDEQSVALQQGLARIADTQRTLLVAATMAAAAAAGALIAAVILLVRA
jgi:chromosome segregation ATPase